MHEKLNVRSLYVSTLLEALLDDALGLIHGQAINVNIVNQGKVNVSGAADASLGVHFGDVIDADFDQVSGAKAHGGVAAGRRDWRWFRGSGGGGVREHCG
jgi:hypothetical protein